jgi:RecB family exonuclease
LPLTPDERDARAAAGLGLPDPTRRAVATARRWRRPIEQVTEVALLVCPRRNERGEALHPHPLWDELVARRSEEERRALVTTSAEGLPTPSGMPPRRWRRAVRAVPGARRSWSVDSGRIPAPERLSPTALGDLIGCSFKWFVERIGRIRAGFTQPLPGEAQLLGTVAHELIAGLLRGPRLAPEEAFTQARAAFDQHGPRLAAPLFIPGSEVTRATARQATGLAARELFRILSEDRLEVVAVEQPSETSALGAVLTGRPDLVVASPLTVIDLKWGGESYRRQSFESGTNYQLAAYAALLAEGAQELPRVANFILRSQRMLTNEPGLFGGAHYVEGPGVAATWEALESAYRAAWSRLDEGLLEAPGNPDELGAVPEEDEVVEGRLRLKPPCWFCDLGRLCGLALEAEAS